MKKALFATFSAILILLFTLIFEDRINEIANYEAALLDREQKRKEIPRVRRNFDSAEDEHSADGKQNEHSEKAEFFPDDRENKIAFRKR